MHPRLDLSTLAPSLPVRARALAAWRLSDYWVTAVKLTKAGGSSRAKSDSYSFPTSFGEAVDSTQAKLNTGVAKTPGGAKKKEVKPVYTVPQNSTLMGSTAMTALIGRVPIDGTVNDPYPFKVIVGAENLTANGIDLPEVAGAVVSGTATGDWTLSCVRGQVRSITFVFNDGTVRTLPPYRPLQ
ncbi:hypothetical protein B2J73_21620 [Stutzerimonas stutzeri]|nr:hypothetical protein B2J73_21620 [Stutzerimonas stutzeri]